MTALHVIMVVVAGCIVGELLWIIVRERLWTATLLPIPDDPRFPALVEPRTVARCR